MDTNCAKSYFISVIYARKDSDLESLSTIDFRYTFRKILLNVLQIIVSIKDPQLGDRVAYPSFITLRTVKSFAMIISVIQSAIANDFTVSFNFHP